MRAEMVGAVLQGPNQRLAVVVSVNSEDFGILEFAVEEVRGFLPELQEETNCAAACRLPTHTAKKVAEHPLSLSEGLCNTDELHSTNNARLHVKKGHENVVRYVDVFRFQQVSGV
jgi:hypothetical protein